MNDDIRSQFLYKDYFVEVTRNQNGWWLAKIIDDRYPNRSKMISNSIYETKKTNAIWEATNLIQRIIKLEKQKLYIPEDK